MPSCMQFGASDFGSTSDLADPEGINYGFRMYLPKLGDGGTKGNNAFSSSMVSLEICGIIRASVARHIFMKGTNLF